MEELYYYIPTNQCPNNGQQISHIQQQQQVQQVQQVQQLQPQLVAYYPSTNLVIPQQELQQQQQLQKPRQRNSQSHPQLYPYPQLMYNNQLVNPRYTTLYSSNFSQPGTSIHNEHSNQITTPIPGMLSNQTTGSIHYNNEINVSPTTVTHNNPPGVQLPPLSSLVSQIKSTSQSCPDISTLTSQSSSSINTMNVNNARGFKSAATSISSASSSNDNKNNTSTTTNNHRNSIPYILTFSTQKEGNLHSVTNHNQSTQLAITNFPVREITPPIYTISPKQNNQNVNKLIVTNRNLNENLNPLLTRNDITVIEPMRMNNTNINDMELNKGKNGKIPSQQRKQCPVCGKICSRPSTLKTHFLIHTGDNPFKCSWVGCKKSFNVKSNMLRHLKSHQRKLEKLAKKQADLLKQEKLKQTNNNNDKKK